MGFIVRTRDGFCRLRFCVAAVAHQILSEDDLVSRPTVAILTWCQGRLLLFDLGSTGVRANCCYPEGRACVGTLLASTCSKTRMIIKILIGQKSKQFDSKFVSTLVLAIG